MAGKSKFKPSETVSLEPVTDEDTVAVDVALETKTAVKGKRTRKPAKVARKPEDDNISPIALTGAVLPTEFSGEATLASLKDGNTTLQAPDLGVIGQAASTLTTTQKQACMLLADLVEQRGPQQVADAMGITVQTMYNWLRVPAFQQSMRLIRQAQFVEIGSTKLMGVYDRELNKANPGSRLLEQIAKTLGFFSDATSINLNVEVGNSTNDFGGIGRQDVL